MTNVNDLAVVGAFVARHPEFAPELLENTLAVILQQTKIKKRKITLENLEQSWTEIVAELKATSPELFEKLKIRTPEQDAETEKYRKQIESLSASEFKEYLKDEKIATAMNNVLDEPRPKKAEPKPAPVAPKPKPLERTAEEIAVESITSDQMKKAFAKGQGSAIERILLGLAAKETRQ